ncbi:unnamed protein product [Strongylus vulgaris]|uniref:Uncharacterized protein n=1 Tax=Strongylus vulgaris TaxID=40348 RepID=A0A3P7LLI1_STRVU|nr:unnamed protein product [Strongylus vulgaris]
MIPSTKVNEMDDLFTSVSGGEGPKKTKISSAIRILLEMDIPPPLELFAMALIILLEMDIPPPLELFAMALMLAD